VSFRHPTSWLMRPTHRSSPALRLFCVPFAGVGPSAFRGWSQRLPTAVEALYVHLPGRESRLRETSVPDVQGLAKGITDAIAPFSDQPFALFGHSLGAIVAFEVARTLRCRALPAPVRLFASACRAPHLPYPFPPLHRLDEDELLRHVNERYEGSVPTEVFENAELRALVLPALRADFAALETYQHGAQRPLECPITVFGGRHDRTVAKGALEGWSVHTSREFRLRLVEGGHFYLQSARQQLIDEISEDVGVVSEDVGVVSEDVGVVLARQPVPGGS
jgi:medium-chain acyl-[acyl-carrier-protein] hydrolase